MKLVTDFVPVFPDLILCTQVTRLNVIFPSVRDDDVLLEIECGSNSGILYLSRLCQGSKGPCIWFQGLIPKELSKTHRGHCYFT